MSRRNRDNPIKATSVTYTNAISVCRKAEPPDVNTAQYLLDLAKVDGVSPNVFMYSAAIWTAERCGNWEVALSMLESMKRTPSSQPNIVSYDGGE